MTTLKHKIIQYKNLAMSCYPHKKKKNHPFRNLHFPNALPGKNGSRSLPNLMVERPRIKLPTTIKAPTKTVTFNTPENPRLNQVKKGERSRQRPIIALPKKT